MVVGSAALGKSYRVYSGRGLETVVSISVSNLIKYSCLRLLKLTLGVLGHRVLLHWVSFDSCLPPYCWFPWVTPLQKKKISEVLLKNDLKNLVGKSYLKIKFRKHESSKAKTCSIRHPWKIKLDLSSRVFILFLLSVFTAEVLNMSKKWY